MILINVLPPEFRKRDAGISPVFLAILAGVLLNAATVAFAIWIHYIRIPHAEETLQSKQSELTRLEQKVQEIKAREQQIAAAELRRDTLFALLGQKVFMARPLHEFVTLLGSQGWTEPGFKVSVTALTVAPQTGGGGGVRGRRGQPADASLQVVTWDWGLKIVGENPELSGNYLKSFFQRVANSEFWARNGFSGDPSDTYTGDAPSYNEDIERVTVDVQLTWNRVVKQIKFVTKPSATVAVNAAPAVEGR